MRWAEIIESDLREYRKLAELDSVSARVAAALEDLCDRCERWAPIVDGRDEEVGRWKAAFAAYTLQPDGITKNFVEAVIANSTAFAEEQEAKLASFEPNVDEDEVGTANIYIYQAQRIIKAFSALLEHGDVKEA